MPDRLREISREQVIAVSCFASAERAEQHQRQRCGVLANFVRQREAVHLGHVHIEDREIECPAVLEAT